MPSKYVPGNMARGAQENSARQLLIKLNKPPLTLGMAAGASAATKLRFPRASLEIEIGIGQALKLKSALLNRLGKEKPTSGWRQGARKLRFEFGH